jgi:ubiquinone/menaquinone biosynthesis C-methylase UbiE
LGSGYDITGTDIDFGQRREKKLKLVEASAEKLPFKDNSFDCVVSVDMLEHLPANIRKKAIFEMIRVARGKVYISFPRGNLSTAIDKAISKYYKFTHKEELGYLMEHQKYTLPGENKVKLYINQAARGNAKKVQITKKLNTNSLLWAGLLLLGFSEVRMLTNFYHKLLLFLPVLNLMHFWPTYRVSYFVDIKNHD